MPENTMTLSHWRAWHRSGISFLRAENEELEGDLPVRLLTFLPLAHPKYPVWSRRKRFIQSRMDRLGRTLPEGGLIATSLFHPTYLTGSFPHLAKDDRLVTFDFFPTPDDWHHVKPSRQYEHTFPNSLAHVTLAINGPDALLLESVTHSNPDLDGARILRTRYPDSLTPLLLSALRYCQERKLRFHFLPVSAYANGHPAWILHSNTDENHSATTEKYQKAVDHIGQVYGGLRSAFKRTHVCQTVDWTTPIAAQIPSDDHAVPMPPVVKLLRVYPTLKREKN